jgi:hypothetical protein
LPPPVDVIDEKLEFVPEAQDVPPPPTETVIGVSLVTANSDAVLNPPAPPPPPLS